MTNQEPEQAGREWQKEARIAGPYYGEMHYANCLRMSSGTPYCTCDRIERRWLLEYTAALERRIERLEGKAKLADELLGNYDVTRAALDDIICDYCRQWIGHEPHLPECPVTRYDALQALEEKEAQEGEAT